MSTIEIIAVVYICIDILACIILLANVGKIRKLINRIRWNGGYCAINHCNDYEDDCYDNDDDDDDDDNVVDYNSRADELADMID